MTKKRIDAKTQAILAEAKTIVQRDLSPVEEALLVWAIYKVLR